MAPTQEALNYGDLVAIARAALIEPEFLDKIRQGNTDGIVQAISPERLPIVKWPTALIEWLTERIHCLMFQVSRQSEDKVN